MTVSSPTAKVLCAGILVADIFVPPLPALPAAGELRATDDFLLDSGGCAANVATCLARLEVSASVCGRVGADVFGDFVSHDLKAKGVDTSGIHRSTSQGTSKTVILPVWGEDRRFIHTFGANAEFQETDIVLDSLAPGDLLYLGGFLIMPTLNALSVARLFQTAKERGITTMLDVVVPAGQGAGGMQELSAILPFTDFFLPNDEEAQALTGETEPLRQAQRFRKAGCGTALITSGKHGTLLYSEDDTIRAEAFPVPFVDGSGAGDAFAAGFIAGLLERWPVEETLRFASAIGASACTRLGCTPGVFTRAEARDFLNQHTLQMTRG
jgi:sugar/nucleoside kinase (ribokinase family)